MTYLCDHPICVRERDCDGHCNAALPPRRLVGWVLEYGAVDLPEDHESRITCKTIHECEAHAAAVQKACDFNSRIYPVYTQPAPVLTDERIDRIADLVIKGMPDGLRGFCKVWGWQQFARALLEVCDHPVAMGYVGRKPGLEASESEPQGATE